MPWFQMRQPSNNQEDYAVNDCSIQLIREATWLLLTGSSPLADEYYTYTLPQRYDGTADNNVLDADADELDDLDKVMEVEDDNMLRFDSIT